MRNKNLTFIIPAAGKSSRFQSKESKIFYRYKKKRILNHVIEKCIKFTDRIIIIVNSQDIQRIKKITKIYRHIKFTFIIQKKPIGMGHAVYIGLKKVNSIYSAVIWADQIFLSSITIKKTIKKFLGKKTLFSFPIQKKKDPYTCVIFDKKKQFKDIIQKRETDKMPKIGYSDCGFFIFNSEKIKKTLNFCIKKKLIITKKTKEIDFLKSFKFFSKKGKFELFKSNYKRDSVGVNYVEDLN